MKVAAVAFGIAVPFKNHSYVAPVVVEAAVNTTLEPAQIVVGPPAVMVGVAAGAVTVTVCVAVPVQLEALVLLTITVCVPAPKAAGSKVVAAVPFTVNVLPAMLPVNVTAGAVEQ